MTEVFSEHIRILSMGLDPDSSHMQEFEDSFRSALAGELTRRGLLRLPPRYLGYGEYNSWTSDLINELAQDCYVYAVLNRLHALTAKLRSLANVEGFLLLNIRHFLSDKQAASDRVGYRVYSNLKAATELVVKRGLATRKTKQEADDRVMNWVLTLFSHHPVSEPITRSLATVIAEWEPDLLFDIGTAKNRVTADLAEKLLALGREGHREVAFRPLLDCLRDAVRSRWREQPGAPPQEVGFEGKGNTLERVPLVRPFLDYEDPARYRELVAQVTSSIRQSKATIEQGKTLLEVWYYLTSSALKPSQRSVSRREVSRALGLSRHEVSEAWKELRRLTQDAMIDLE